MIKDYDLCGHAPKDHSPSTVKLHKCSLTSVLVTLLNFLSDLQITLYTPLWSAWTVLYGISIAWPGYCRHCRQARLPVNHILMKSGTPPPLAITPPNWGSAVFTVLWVPLSYRVARPGFSDSHGLPGDGVQFSTGLSRSVSGQRSSAAIYPAQCTVGHDVQPGQMAISGQKPSWVHLLVAYAPPCTAK